MTKRTREWRFAQRERILNRRMNMERLHGWCSAHGPDGSRWWDIKGNERTLNSWDDVFEARYRFARIQIDTHTPCSCYMCGNPRKYFNTPTFQEIRHRIKEIEEFDEMDLRPLNFRYRITNRY